MVASRCRAAAAALVVLAACPGGGDGDGATTTSAPTTGPTTGTDTTSPTTGQPRPVAGSVREVLASRAEVDGRRAASGDRILANGLVSTDDSGVVVFEVQDKLPDCQLQPRSAIRVLPAPGRLLDLVGGTTLCRTTPGAQNSIELGASNTRIDARDPVFSVSATGGGQVVVRATRGFVQVRARHTSRQAGRLLGPGQRVATGGDGQPRDTEQLDAAQLDPMEQRAVRRMEAALPPADYGFPRAGSSPTLARISGGDRVLRVALDGVASDESEGFTDSFLGFLGTGWKVEIQRRSMDAGDAAAALAAGEVDLAVSPSTLPGARATPFFGDTRDRTWWLHTRGADAQFELALRRFLVTALEFAEYAKRYTASFDQLPRYEAVRPLIFPSG